MSYNAALMKTVFEAIGGVMVGAKVVIKIKDQSYDALRLSANVEAENSQDGMGATMVKGYLLQGADLKFNPELVTSLVEGDNQYVITGHKFGPANLYLRLDVDVDHG
jgi:hypothetical protein